MNNNASPVMQKRIIRIGGLVEALPYFLLGASATCVLLVAAFISALDAWHAGDRIPALGLGVGTVALGAVFGCATYRKRPILALGCLLVLTGAAIYAWGSLGFQLPFLAS